MKLEQIDDDLFCLFTEKQVFKIHFSVAQEGLNVASLWSDEWSYHSGCLLITVSEKKRKDSRHPVS